MHLVNFVHLKLHTEFSLVDGMVRIKPLLKRMIELGMPTLAVTDQSNMCCLVKFYNAARSSGVKPICGVDVWIENNQMNQEPFRLSLLCANTKGYRNLTKLISKGYLENQKNDKMLLKKEWVWEHAEGVIALSGGRLGDVGQSLLNEKEALATKQLQQWMQAFPNHFYIELQRTKRDGENKYIHAAVALAEKMNCPVVATNDVMFLHKKDFGAHEARVCIAKGEILDDEKRERNYTEEQYLKSTEEMIALFSDIPEAIENTVEIAKRCNVEVKQGEYFLPKYPIPENQTMDEFFQEVCTKGLKNKLAEFNREDPEIIIDEKKYFERLKFEMNVILEMKFPGYFLIVMDFIQWAKNNFIMVGPGRGSGAGSLVAYVLDITDIDPLKYDLLFERFLNPERVSLPDFDVDFCMENRDRVIDYVAETYGRDAVSQIITFGTMAAKAVVRDVARAQGKPLGLADKLSKMIPFDIGMTLKVAQEQEVAITDFLAMDTSASEIWEMALKLEGVTRNVGKHAGGVVIAPTKLTDFSPIYCDEEGQGVVTQFDKYDIEAVGLVKFDFLGLRTLTIIDWALRMINKKRQGLNEDKINILKISLNDQKVFHTLRTGETTAVFQLESKGIKDLIKRLKPDCFEDVIALVALFRPGPLQSGMVDNFINRKHGREAISYPDVQYQHELLKPILSPTYGIILYQEQVMQIAQVLAGYSLGEADLLRRAMGQKKPEEMAKQRTIFEEGAKTRGIDGMLAIKIFDLVEKFAGYGFNKSHSAAYALLSYQTQWLKVYYPAEFMAAVLSAEMQNTDKVLILIEDAKRMGIAILPPSVNSGSFMFTVNEENNIVYGLGALKGIGSGPVEAIVKAVESGGCFSDLFDFCSRVDLSHVNKRAMDSLLGSGALDELGLYRNNKAKINSNRAILQAAQIEAIKSAEQAKQNINSGHMDLFGDLISCDDQANYKRYIDTAAWSDKVRLQYEKETLGFYLTGHPIDEYKREVSYISNGSIKDLKPEKGRMVNVIGLVLELRIIKNKRGKSIAIATLDDSTGRLEVSLFTDVYQEYGEKIEKNKVIIAVGEVSHDEYTDRLRVRVSQVFDFGEARSRYAKALYIQLGHSFITEERLDALQSVLKVHPGKLPVQLGYHNKKAKADLRFSDEWNVNPNDELLQSLRQVIDEEAVSVVY